MLNTCTLRTCTACNKSLPSTREHFYYRNKSRKILTKWCVRCYKSYFDARRPEPKPKLIIPAPPTVIPAKAGIHKTSKDLYSGLKPTGMTNGANTGMTGGAGITPVYKTCSACKQSLPATRECFYWRNSRQGTFLPVCIVCDKNGKRNRAKPTLESIVKRFLDDEISTADLSRILRPEYGDQTRKIVNAARREYGLPVLKELLD